MYSIILRVNLEISLGMGADGADLGGFQEQGVNLTEALPLGLGGEVGILVPGLGLTGESGFQVFLCLCSGVFGYGKFHLFKF